MLIFKSESLVLKDNPIKQQLAIRISKKTGDILSRVKYHKDRLMGKGIVGSGKADIDKAVKNAGKKNLVSGMEILAKEQGLNKKSKYYE